MPPFNRAAFCAGIAEVYLYLKAAEFFQPSPGVVIAIVLTTQACAVLVIVFRRAADCCCPHRRMRWLRQFAAKRHSRHRDHIHQNRG